VDAIGSTSLVIEADLLSAAAEVLARLGFSDFRIRLNHRKLLTAVLSAAGVAAEHHGAALVALDKLDKTSSAAVAADLVNRGVSAAAAEALLGRLATGLTDDVMLEGADDVRAIERLCAHGAAAGRVEVDLSLARGLSYYTGAIFEIAVPDLAGSLGGGGRYDELIGMFLGQHVPACGISLGLERILVVMGERGMFPDELTATPADVMVTIWNTDTVTDAIRLAGELRAAGLRVEVYPEADKLGKQFKYADARHIPFVMVQGDQERERGEVAVKNLKSGEQQVMPQASVAEFVARRLDVNT
jgi:histidyl-tRNA synthetase